jgi:hypothetical protein
VTYRFELNGKPFGAFSFASLADAQYHLSHLLDLAHDRYKIAAKSNPEWAQRQLEVSERIERHVKIVAVPDPVNVHVEATTLADRRRPRPTRLYSSKWRLYREIA